MTDREKAIVMAHTGICMLTGTKFAIFHKYVEDIMGRPVQTIEMGIKSVRDEIAERSQDDFIALCREDQCGDCISRSETYKKMLVLQCKKRERYLDIDDVHNVIYKMPILISPMPKMGKWRRVSMDKYVQHATYYYECSECKGQIIGEYKYCPNCGSRMEAQNEFCEEKKDSESN